MMSAGFRYISIAVGCVAVAKVLERCRLERKVYSRVVLVVPAFVCE